MSISFTTAFTTAGLVYDVEDPDSDQPIIYFDIECPIGPTTSGTFRLMAYPQIGPLGDEYVRFCITPLYAAEEGEDISPLALIMSQMNNDLVDACLSFDHDRDLCLICDRPLPTFTAATVTQTIAHLQATIELIYRAFNGDTYDEDTDAEELEPATLAERFRTALYEDLALDYSVESLERFEFNVDNEHRTFLRDEDLLTANVRTFGAYIGEVLVRHGLGRWDLADPLEDSVVVVGSRRYQPMRMARAFLESDQALRPSAMVQRALTR
ncbi:hypothetical protein [Candidatus Chloroploca sp. Khr17]|uniref:hypothetical protein n=1 Tax=Candidatus Chloroploca sp. Khr17 TaxID=2496869 RepID=UPI00101C8F08|nr:hypothetical protein [Candidatus Chloroploca sp. Khr17]